ncbi:hypothetical protein K8B83_09640 [Shewanella inventionis]|nr:hypothetical protein [Shewanella inventionis]UAL45038.1 hypothetical protein K8B83_09640 [Shewanella inventionis]
MIELNFVLELAINISIQDLVQVISTLASAYKDYASALFIIAASKRLYK